VFPRMKNRQFLCVVEFGALGMEEKKKNDKIVEEKEKKEKDHNNVGLFTCIAREGI
jgi:hypothetical protein